ncbi:MAG: HD domain-containing protein [Proteobacteria bacterium]|nr:HD domain-containing protein [Pseudomonadota bacterium]
MDLHKIASNSLISFADVAHGTLNFDRNNETESLVLKLIDTKWVQRLRNISQTGNTKLVYMFAEHSRFGHSLGVAYLALLLMKQLKNYHPNDINEYELAVAAAALLHDIGHVSPGSHLAEKVWSNKKKAKHEHISARIIIEDPEISNILDNTKIGLKETIVKILKEDSSVPAWTKAVISGGGWNADRGNWTIVDSTMCAVTYGRYNISSLIDAFRLSDKKELILHESRLDALTHFFVARDSMYRQIYQHRVLQAADSLTQKIVERIKDLLTINQITAPAEFNKVKTVLEKYKIESDSILVSLLAAADYSTDLNLDQIFMINEHWWNYHLSNWTNCDDQILSDLSSRLRDRKLFKTIRLNSEEDKQNICREAENAAKSLGLDIKYYISVIKDSDTHRGKNETPPLILLDNGKIIPVTDVEPLIAQILALPTLKREWLCVPKEIKTKLGLAR